MPSANVPLVIEKGEDFSWTADVYENKQVVTLTGSPSGGTFTLYLWGGVTGAIAYNATAAAVKAALEALAVVGSGNVTVTGSAGGPWTVTFNENVKRLPDLTHPVMKAFAALTPSGGVSIARGVRDLTGYTAQAQLWGDLEDVEQATTDPLATFTVALNSPVGRITVTLAEATVNALADCAGVWGLRLISGGVKTMYASGAVTIRARTVRT